MFDVPLSSAISDLLVAPLQERIDDWKKTVVSLDREHARGWSKYFTAVDNLTSSVMLIAFSVVVKIALQLCIINFLSICILFCCG